MNLSFKDTKFIIEALNHLINSYNQRLSEIEDLEEHEDEASELGNDTVFLESLCTELEDISNGLKKLKTDGYSFFPKTPPVGKSHLFLTITN